MDLRQLRYFIALAEHRSFVRAADAMGITQPAFSRSIQGLEQELGCQLVDRGSKDLRPTPEGQVVLQHALSLVQGSAQQLVPDAVADFINRHPRVQISLDVDNWEKLSRALLREEIEFFVADIRDFEADPNFQTRPLTPRRGQFFCRPQHPLLGKDSLSTNDLFNYPLASTLIPPGIRKLLANLSGKIDFAANIRCENMHALIRIVRQTDAIGIASDETLRPYLQRGELQPLQWRNLPQNLDSLSARCGIISRSGYRLSAAAKAMIETLVELDQAQHAAA
ncbi:LysR family transcriptional regulator [Pseudomonas aeruginosa]|uniref:LysR family transcriptional regulator n=1 Tax=Pseudomonas aeruginosa TaxID=287 RepID=UPI000B8B1873|nr:LysR family transcriptional regulator [Pseudomonas aeruginosa]OXR95715.1 LysR family transcriptional regulator [Pseudomonas aeruginosa]UNT18747.1 LysR family transcriptional regulator [Pseudomonas aeruginosa]